jgi:hypothetical protein
VNIVDVGPELSEGVGFRKSTIHGRDDTEKRKTAKGFVWLSSIICLSQRCVLAKGKIPRREAIDSDFFTASWTGPPSVIVTLILNSLVE